MLFSLHPVISHPNYVSTLPHQVSLIQVEHVYSPALLANYIAHMFPLCMILAGILVSKSSMIVTIIRLLPIGVSF